MDQHELVRAVVLLCVLLCNEQRAAACVPAALALLSVLASLFSFQVGSSW
jgi:hypothetical protein